MLLGIAAWGSFFLRRPEGGGGGKVAADQPVGIPAEILIKPSACKQRGSRCKGQIYKEVCNDRERAQRDPLADVLCLCHCVPLRFRPFTITPKDRADCEGDHTPARGRETGGI